MTFKISVCDLNNIQNISTYILKTDGGEKK